MVRKYKSQGILKKNNKPRELSEYNLFVQKECEKIKEKGIRISGRGNLLIHISKLWKIKKLQESKKTKIYSNDDIDILSSMISNVNLSIEDNDVKKIHIHSDIDILTSMISTINLTSSSFKIKTED
jgi:hypothetical protein